MNVKNDKICMSITLNGKRCSRVSRCDGFCTMHYNKQNIIGNNVNKQNIIKNNVNKQNIIRNNVNRQNIISNIFGNNIDKHNIINNIFKNNINKPNTNTNANPITNANANPITNTNTNAITNINRKLKSVQDNLLVANDEIKSLTNIKMCSENKIETLNKKIIELSENNKKLQNEIVELENDFENKIKIRVNLLKDEYKKYIIDYDKFNNVNDLYNKMKNSINLITHTTLGDKIRVIKFDKNGIKIIIKYFAGTEKNIDEFTKKIYLDFDNLIDSFSDKNVNYKNEWIDNIITNLNNYTTKFDNYFTSNIENAKINFNWIKNDNKYILQIYPDIDTIQLVINTINNYKNAKSNL
jgi:hypothetical protein